MRFKIFLESHTEGIFTYNPKTNSWHKGSMYSLEVYIDSKSISINGSPYDTYWKKPLHALMKQFPDLKDVKLDYDGFSPGTLSQYLADKSYEKMIFPKRFIPYFYHGTSYDRWINIEKEGLQPRNITGSSPVFGKIYNAPSSHMDKVYLSASYGNAVKFAARDAVMNKNDYPVILKINSKGMDFNLLQPDEDSKETDWVKSLYSINSIAYSGSISPEFIELYAYLDEQKWKLISSENDWLGKQMENLPKEPKWIKP